MLHSLTWRLLADLWNKIKRESSSTTVTISDDDIVILVAGPTGSGKSWFTREATKGELIQQSRGYHPFTTKAQAIRCDLTDEAKKDLQKEGIKSIVFIDTPSFLTGCYDINAQREIETLIYRTKFKPRYLGIIYMHRIESDPALEPVQNHLNELASVPWIRDTRHPLQVHIVMSYDRTSGQVSDFKISKHESSLQTQMASLDKSKWWPSMHQVRFEGEPEVAWRAVEELLRSGRAD